MPSFLINMDDGYGGNNATFLVLYIKNQGSNTLMNNMIIKKMLYIKFIYDIYQNNKEKIKKGRKTGIIYM